MLPPAGLHHEGHSLGPPSSEQDGGDGNPLGALPLWVDDGTLAGWCAESVNINFFNHIIFNFNYFILIKYGFYLHV